MSRLNGRRAEAEAQGLRVNVAILGAGRIAHSMARTLVAMAADPRYAGLVAPYAVAARDGGRAAAFAAEYGFPVSYGSYYELLADPDVDRVYIATPHRLHAEQGIACLKAGKNILVEKSFTANAAQARALLDAADGSGLLCTEAIWTRYMPSRAIVDRIVASGAIGELRSISANLCYPVSGKARMSDPAMAGGALLDVGVYPLNFIDMVMGGHGEVPVERVETSMTPYAPTGVDAQNSTTLYYANGVMAVSTSSMLRPCGLHLGRQGVRGVPQHQQHRSDRRVRRRPCRGGALRCAGAADRLRVSGRRRGERDSRRARGVRRDAARRFAAHRRAHGRAAGEVGAEVSVRVTVLRQVGRRVPHPSLTGLAARHAPRTPAVSAAYTPR